MATITATSVSSPIVRSVFVHVKLRATSSSPILGLPKMKRGGTVKCSVQEGKPRAHRGASLTAVAAAATNMWGPAALALVDERMSTEGTGLPFGLSNGLLGWILLAGFGLIWSLYFVYTSGLDEDEDSGLSL